jgi:2-polyprenyl-3-methyl-5-hydroxy-6-metoxy-1,4-benzoquinol methylase
VRGALCRLLGRAVYSIINNFIEVNKIDSVIDFGCGDGNQLKYIKIKKYLGIDISQKSIEICKTKFRKDKTKIFKILENYEHEKSDLVLSLDVIYHLCC